MKVFRFMSYEELRKYKNGENLYNNTKHQAKTNSRGFCFFNIDDFKPEYAWIFIKGAISADVCAVFEVDESLLRKTYGIYNDPNKTLEEILNWVIKPMKVDEYCTAKYNNKNFKLIKYSTNKLSIFSNYKNFDWREI
jgi:hypothetical protein